MRQNLGDRVLAQRARGAVALFGSISGSTPLARVGTMLVAFMLLAVAAPQARARQQVVLTWRWVQGDERRYVIESNLDQTVTTGSRNDPGSHGAGGSGERRIKATQIFHVVERVPGVDDHGVATVTRTYERVEVRGTDDGPDGVDRFDYDSAQRNGPGQSPPSRANPPRGRIPGGALPGGRPGGPAGAPPSSQPSSQTDESHPMVAPYAALAGKTITFRVDPEGHVLDCTGADEAMEGVFSPPGEDSGMNPIGMLYAAAVTNESLAREFEQGLGLIPNRVVRRGEDWDHSVVQTLPLVGDLRTSMQCRLLGVQGREPRQNATISNKGGMTLEAGPAGMQGLGGLFQVNLGMSDMEGTTEFDVTGGFITSSRQKSVSEWEVYAPDFTDLDRMGEAVKTTHRIEQDVSMRLER